MSSCRCLLRKGGDVRVGLIMVDRVDRTLLGIDYESEMDEDGFEILGKELRCATVILGRATEARMLVESESKAGSGLGGFWRGSG